MKATHFQEKHLILRTNNHRFIGPPEKKASTLADQNDKYIKDRGHLTVFVLNLKYLLFKQVYKNVLWIY